MEDAAVLGIKPVGAITVGGKLPKYLEKDLEGAKSVGEKCNQISKHYFN